MADEKWKRPAPPRAGLINLSSGERFDFQFNPETFTEPFGVNYARHEVPGLSYEILNYLNTKNVVIPLTIYLSELLAGESPIPLGASSGEAYSMSIQHSNRVLNAKAFLQALVYPIDTPSGGWKAPPLVMFVWPSVVRMVSVVTSLSFTHERFSERNLSTIALTAEITLEENRDIQRFSGDVRREGALAGQNPRYGRG